MSRPARSPTRNGPIAKPNFSSALSTCCGSAPCISSPLAAAPYLASMRLPMKPSQTPETTPIFLIFLAIAMQVASTSGAVLSPRTISSSRITLAGLKKCRPITSCGRLVKPAIVLRFSAEVLDARIAPGLHTSSSVLKTCCLTSMFSNTASITRSTSRIAS